MTAFADNVDLCAGGPRLPTAPGQSEAYVLEPRMPRTRQVLACEAHPTTRPLPAAATLSQPILCSASFTRPSGTCPGDPLAHRLPCFALLCFCSLPARACPPFS